MNNQVLTVWPGGFSALMPHPQPYTEEHMESMRSMLQPRSNRLPQDVASRPRQVPLTDPSPQELTSRPLNIGVSEDVAERHFRHLRPGPAFGHSQTGLFGGYGRSFWKHVADVYDWERSMCTNPIHRPGLREMAAGIRLIIGDEFADHIFAPHGYLAHNTSSQMSNAERQAYARSMYMVMIYMAEGVPNQEEFVILLMKLPDRTVLTFGASSRNGEDQKLLHKTAVDTLHRMLQENTLPGVIYNHSIPTTMRVTSGSSWANPYLTLEAFRVFIRECRRQNIDYEDWTTSYTSISGPERRAEAVRSNWLGDLRAALGHRVDLPLQTIPSNTTKTRVGIPRQPRYISIPGPEHRVEEVRNNWLGDLRPELGHRVDIPLQTISTNTTKTRVSIPRQPRYNGSRYPVIAEESVFQDVKPEDIKHEDIKPEDVKSEDAWIAGAWPENGQDAAFGPTPQPTYTSDGTRQLVQHLGSPPIQGSMWRDVARSGDTPEITSPSHASDTSGWGLPEYVANNATRRNEPDIGSPSNASDTSGWGLPEYFPSNTGSYAGSRSQKFS